MKNRKLTSKAFTRRNALAIAMAASLGFAGVAMGQATTGTIFGTASSSAGGTVKVVGSSGTTRTVTVGADGRYSVGNLPVGTYTVTLNKNGETVSSRNNVNIAVGAGTEVDFASQQSAQNLGAVNVNAAALPSIDVTSVSSSTTITAADLDRLPVGRNAESIALLSPGTVSGSGYFGNVVSFGGAGVTENAYYVNGYNTTGTYSYTGSAYQLPYGSIAQQQTYTGGYGAKYGRSDGGVLNQVGKRGSNDWHFGGQVVWSPRHLQAAPKNVYYPEQDLKPGQSLSDKNHSPGQLQRYRSVNKTWTTQYSGYIGGALVKDKLFFYLAAEQTKQKSRSNGSVVNRTDTYSSFHSTNYYGKIDWNINDNNVFEYTALKYNTSNGSGSQYRFDNDTYQDTTFLGANSINKYDNDTQIFHYTSYLSDAATLSVLYGKTNISNPVQYPFKSDLPGISGSGSQDPSLNGGNAIINNQTRFNETSAYRGSRQNSLRVDFSYQLGDHLLEAGIDNVNYSASNQGDTMSGPGYGWIYNATDDPSKPISEGLGVGAPNSNYYVTRYIFSTATSMSAAQKAWYVQDQWQATDNLLLKIGVRNDHFSNSNNTGVKFVDETNQWEPRLGFSWDVFGDSSFKVYGNAGRYYLALPQSVAERAATASTYTREYFTYTGINDNGVPTGLTPVKGIGGAPPPGPTSANNEYGQTPDAGTVTAQNLEAQYQDEFILGFDKTLGPDWNYGAKLTYRKLGTLIDDECAPGGVAKAIAGMGLDPNDYAYADPGCRIFNPGQTADFKVMTADGSSSILVPVTNEDFGNFPDPKRKYYGVDLYLEHPFDGKWQARIDYTFSRNWGNSEGQVRSDIGQTDVSKTEDWDHPELMEGANGYLSNHRRHQLKIRGAYQLTPEWLFSGTLRVQSGTPESCLGFYGPDQADPTGYGSDYHWCRGKLSPPGSSGFTPWTRQLNLGVRYMPSFADHKLAFRLNVFNVLNEQKVLQTEPHLHPRYAFTVNNTYHNGIYFEDPRYVRLSVSYDY